VCACVNNEVMNEPIRTMPCLHSGCLQCLETYSLRSLQDNLDGTSLPISSLSCPGSLIIDFLISRIGSGSREVKCPKCHGPFQVPLKGAEDLPTNYFTAGVVTAANASAKIDPNNVRCELCEENEATVKCSNCTQFHCDACKKAHLKTKGMTNHQHISVDEALKEGSASSAPRILHCQKHPHQEVNSYCKTDQTAVCAECVIDFHKGHEVDRLVNISKGFTDTISTLVNKVPFFFFFLP